MKISLQWLSQYCDISPLLQKLGTTDMAHRFSIHIAEIDGIETYGIPEPVVVGRVLSTAPHPDSDHLNLVEVSVGSQGTRKIVCGAANVVGAQFVPVALEGAKLAPDFVIAKRKVRGQDSEGMICSEDELGLADARAEGILRLENICPLEVLTAHEGKSFWELPFAIPGYEKDFSYSLRDTVFEIDNKFITNRPDLFSVVGNARELSALFHLPLQKNILSLPAVSASDAIPVQIQTEKCLAYAALKIDLPTTQTPWILQVLARRSGQSVKNLTVDITNLISTEFGQPMHAFDAEKITGQLSVRAAQEGETLEALDGKTYTLTQDDVVIADAARVLAIAGVIGGAYSAVGADTKTVIFEAATFDAVSVRKTVSRIGCRTESAQKFEKSLNPALPTAALARVCDYVRFAGYSAVPHATFSYQAPSACKHIAIAFPFAFVSQKLGYTVSFDRAQEILTDLGFEQISGSQEGTISLVVPSWRATKDISRPEDIVEEIGRIIGYDVVPAQKVMGLGKPVIVGQELSSERILSEFFSAKGFYDLIGYSFVSRATQDRLGIDAQKTICIQNPLSQEQAEMRQSIFTTLLPTLSSNLKRQKVAAYFESGKIFAKEHHEFHETLAAAGATVGWSLEKLQEVLVSYVHTFYPTARLTLQQHASFPEAHPNMSAVICADATPVVAFGALHPQIAASFDISGEVFVFSLLGTLPSSIPTTHAFSPLPKYQGIDREFSFILDEKTPAADLVATISSADALVQAVTLGEVFRDSVKIGEGKKSVFVSVLLRHAEKTLTDADAAAAQEKITRACADRGYILRSA